MIRRFEKDGIDHAVVIGASHAPEGCIEFRTPPARAIR